jgi:hypothetical protein
MARSDCYLTATLKAGIRKSQSLSPARIGGSSLRDVRDDVNGATLRLGIRRHQRLSPPGIGGKRRLTGDDWTIEVLVIA